jgi:hypothetical protein
METDPSDQPASFPSARSWRQRARRARWRQVRRGVVIGVCLTAVIPIAALTPYLRQDRSLDRVVAAVALDWRDFGRESAEQRLQTEMLAAGLEDHLRAGACVLEEVPERRVHCTWGTRLSLPPLADELTGSLQLPLRFSSEAVVERGEVGAAVSASRSP